MRSRYLIVFLTIFTITITAQQKPLVVLELYTSQGCSSCPPADEVLAELKKTQSNTIIPLSYHVDYWDYIGWKDPFASPEFTKKQRAYNYKFASNSIYTPQLVINGKEHIVGSRRRLVYQKVKQYSQQKDATHTIQLHDVKRSPKQITVDYNIDGKNEHNIVRLLLVIDERTTSVQRGENSNRTLTNSNIVISETLRKPSSETTSVSIPIPKLVTSKDKLRLVVLIQQTDLSIVGGTQVDI